MNLLPFQIDNFRVPTLLSHPVLDSQQGESISQYALKNYGKRLNGRSRVSTRSFGLNSVFFKSNSCYDTCNQLTMTEFRNKIDSIVDKEVTILFISQDNRIYTAQCELKYPKYDYLDDEQYSWSTLVTIIGAITEITNDLWIDTPCDECLCATWDRAKNLKYSDINKDCRIFKTFFRPEFIPEYPEYFPNVRSSLIFNSGQMLINGGQAVVYTGGFVNPYPEILSNDYSTPVSGNCQIEFYYFFEPPPSTLTYRRLYINDKYIEIPLDKTMLAVANGKIYTGTNYYNLTQIDTFDNQLYSQSIAVSYQNNLNTKDYYGYYKIINTI